MQGSTGRPSGTAVAGEFFIPDLCAPRPVLFLVLLTELMVLVYTLVISQLPQFNWNVLALTSLFVQWLVLGSTALLCALRAVFARLGLPLAVAGSLALVLLVTALSSQLALWLYPELLTVTAGGWWLLRNLLVAAVIGGIALRYFYLQQQLALRERSELQARLDSLRSRIRPHFLFNTLNSIASLIASHPERAETAVEDLAELFRASLREAGRDTTVADELRLCELYLGIEQLRLGQRLQFSCEVEAGLLELPMPSLILQPLVENAVYHGISRLPEGGQVSMRLFRNAGQLVVVVANPVPLTAAGIRGERIAVSNIEQRLLGLFGDDASLQLGPEGDQFKAELRYPVAEPA
ncbi:sensor histidine kinase [Kineobactrum salinum]|uniref:Sensor histidine kinase n=1 Tax=Kineobactrum salinum TaxID=2708301 RepID=A0A6C0TZS0_9GAMM|nr:histidine kinase [Kineobactrum salinum]QIB65256.1 sensor histidine kinase [Kineobactrum salinum]